MNKAKQFGVTLIELIVVVLVLAILSAFASPSFQSLIQKVKTENIQSTLVKMLKEAKRTARAESTTTRVKLENDVSTLSTLTLESDAGLSEIETSYDDVTFQSEATVTFSAVGAVTPPNGESMFRLVVVNVNGGQKRYVDVLASGQIVSHLPGFSP